MDNGRITNAWNHETILLYKGFNRQDKEWRKCTKHWSVPRIEVFELDSVQCNLVDKQYQQKFEVLYNFAPNKFCTYLLNVEPSNLRFLKRYITEFDEIVW